MACVKWYNGAIEGSIHGAMHGALHGAIRFAYAKMNHFANILPRTKIVSYSGRMLNFAVAKKIKFAIVLPYGRMN